MKTARLFAFVRKFLVNSNGATSIEYGVMTAFAVVILFASFSYSERNFDTSFRELSVGFQNSNEVSVERDEYREVTVTDVE